jgi:hypothetical protein
MTNVSKLLRSIVFGLITLSIIGLSGCVVHDRDRGHDHDFHDHDWHEHHDHDYH